MKKVKSLQILTKHIETNNHLSPSQSKRKQYLAKLQITKQVLEGLKKKDNLIASIEKEMEKHKSKKKGKIKKSKTIKTYSGCQGLNQLNQISKAQCQEIHDLMKQKQKLMETCQKLRFYNKNAAQSREAYFVEQIERTNMIIKYLHEQGKNKERQHRKQLEKIKKSLSKEKQRNDEKPRKLGKSRKLI